MPNEVSSEVVLDRTAIRNLEKAAVRALEKTGEALHTEVVQATVVPRDTGNLQNEAFFVDMLESAEGEVALVHSTPYARRLYFHPEYHFHTDKNPEARGEWYEPWISGENREFVRRAFAAFLRQEGGV